MASPATDRRPTNLERQRLRDAAKPVSSLVEARQELKRITKAVEALQSRRVEARNRFDRDGNISGAFVTDQMRAEARTKATAALSATEDEIRAEARLLSVRAQNIAGQISDAADLPSLAALDPEVLSAASQMVPLLQIQIAGLPLSEIERRLRATQLRGDEAELLALTTVARAHLVDRREAPRPEDKEQDLGSALNTLGVILDPSTGDDADDPIRDETLAPDLRRAGQAVQAVSAVDQLIARDRSDRGEVEYDFLENL